MKKVLALVLSMMMVMIFNTSVFAAETTDCGTEEQEVNVEMNHMYLIVEDGQTRLMPANIVDPLSVTYHYSISRILNGNLEDSFSVPKKGLFPFKRTIYISGGATFRDGKVRNITVKVGNNSYTFEANGSVAKRGEMSVSTEIPVMISVTGIVSPCTVVLDVYTSD